MTDPKIWWEQMPPVTKVLFGGSFGVTVAANFGILPMMSLVFDGYMIWHKFQIWRMVTCLFFFGKLGFPFLMSMFWLYSYSLRLEQGHFEKRTADYVWACTFVWAVLLIIAWLASNMIIGQSFVMAIVYIWCSMNADQIVNFWFGMAFQAMYFPWVLLAMGILTGGSGIPDLIGIFAGHLYFFLKIKYPRDFGGKEFLNTPEFVHRLFEQTAEPGRPTRTFGGAGRRLVD